MTRVCPACELTSPGTPADARCAATELRGWLRSLSAANVSGTGGRSFLGSVAELKGRRSTLGRGMVHEPVALVSDACGAEGAKGESALAGSVGCGSRSSIGEAAAQTGAERSRMSLAQLALATTMIATWQLPGSPQRRPCTRGRTRPVLTAGGCWVCLAGVLGAVWDGVSKERSNACVDSACGMCSGRSRGGKSVPEAQHRPLLVRVCMQAVPPHQLPVEPCRTLPATVMVARTPACVLAVLDRTQGTPCVSRRKSGRNRSTRLPWPQC